MYLLLIRRHVFTFILIYCCDCSNEKTLIYPVTSSIVKGIFKLLFKSKSVLSLVPEMR